MWKHEIEVRCCCDAHLVGYMRLSIEPKKGRRFRMVLRPPGDPAVLEFECAEVGVPWSQLTPDGQGLEARVEMRLALKSNDYPLEQLRRIPGFREVPAP